MFPSFSLIESNTTHTTLNSGIAQYLLPCSSTALALFLRPLSPATTAVKTRPPTSISDYQWTRNHRRCHCRRHRIASTQSPSIVGPPIFELQVPPTLSCF